jgi:hypothetical protein
MAILTNLAIAKGNTQNQPLGISHISAYKIFHVDPLRPSRTMQDCQEPAQYGQR